ncbi:MAG: YraN family protein [Chloroflexi bacterium]|nr:YraN family protein [Chloroflexota bacterium]
MTKHNQKVGAWGEETAAVWLAGKGYEVSRRNVRTPYGEIDIVAHKNGVAYFIEVKTLTSSKSFFPEHQITARKPEHKDGPLADRCHCRRGETRRNADPSSL